MAQIQSGATSDLLTVDPTSKAARVTLYDSAGNEIHVPPAGAYLAPVNIRHTGAPAAGTTVWAMRAGASKTCFIRRIHLLQGFDGTALAASGTLRYEIVRFSTATPTGGTAITTIKKRSSYGASGVADIRQDATGAGLTTTSVVFETSALVLALPVIQLEIAAPATAATPGAQVLHDINFEAPGERYGTFELAVNEGLAIRVVSVTTIIGSGLYGHIEWDER